MSNNDSVFHSDPEILGGEPVFKGTRVPVNTLVDYLESGESINDFLEGFPSEKWEQVIQLPPRNKPSPSNWWKRCRRSKRK